jgi:hypothetical protein
LLFPFAGFKVSQCSRPRWGIIAGHIDGFGHWQQGLLDPQGLQAQFKKFFRLRDGHAFGAPHGNGFEVFRSHDGTHTGSPGGIAHAGLDGGISGYIFAGRPDTNHFDLGISEFLADGILGPVGIQSPEMRGVLYLNLIILDGNVDRVGGFAF